MELKEISLTQLLNNTIGTEYFSVFVKLISDGGNAVFYEGIGDTELHLIEEIEENINASLPSNYMDFLSYLNGGHFFGVDLFSVVDKEHPNSLIGRNFYSQIREELGLKETCLVIGKFGGYIIFVDCDDSEGSYALMDIRNNERLEFESLGALIGFIYYIFIIKENKKIEKEKEQIVQMREKLHEDFKKRTSSIKKENQKNREKLMAKVAAKGLKEKMRKSRRK